MPYIKKFINELKIRKEVDFHTNILQIHGISKFDNHNIYKACWENDPDERPSIKQVVSYLKSINQDINEETNSNKFPDSDDVEKIIDELIVHLIKMHDEFGYGFAEVKQIIEQNINNINQTLLNNIPNWKKARNRSRFK
ncbi:kinase-like domain-containing protein [Rhizophagus irregularis DAOM 181602=DAOM 197198]|nr:kinase-like domain-containing protein [Rhizophagus irregularis DAOM 181602=DAOM 197198]